MTRTEGVGSIVRPENAEFTVDVLEKTDLSPDIVSLTIRRSDGEVFPTWEPGAHIDLILPNGQERQYSLCGPVDEHKTWRIAVLREPDSRGGSTYVHDFLHVGHRVHVRGPRNHFALADSPRYVFAAGGIGVTPLIPMAQSAADSGADWCLIYCARSREAMAFLPELQERFGDRIVVNADDEVGLFDFAEYFAAPRADTLVYACGPTPFLDAVEKGTAGWPLNSLRVEHFSPLAVDHTTNVEFEVELAQSGRVLRVPPDCSLLDVLRGEDIPILSSCAEGTCGTCETAVISGDIDHRDAVLTPEEQATGEIMMVCVSRCSSGRLVLDL